MAELNWKATNDFDEASDWLANLPDSPLAMDFEIASRWTASEKEQFKSVVKFASKWQRIKLQQKIDSDGLSHPALTYPTHFSCAWSETDAIVIILDTDEIRQAVLNWIANDHRMQIWHNFSFDGKVIYYHTGKFPAHYEDTQILAKTLLNHVDNFKSRTGLKELMNWAYGDWALVELDFNLENMYDERMLKYAAIDSMATMALYNDIQRDLQGGN